MKSAFFMSLAIFILFVITTIFIIYLQCNEWYWYKLILVLSNRNINTSNVTWRNVTRNVTRNVYLLSTQGLVWYSFYSNFGAWFGCSCFSIVTFVFVYQGFIGTELFFLIMNKSVILKKNEWDSLKIPANFHFTPFWVPVHENKLFKYNIIIIDKAL